MLTGSRPSDGRLVSWMLLNTLPWLASVVFTSGAAPETSTTSVVPATRKVISKVAGWLTCKVTLSCLMVAKPDTATVRPVSRGRNFEKLIHTVIAGFHRARKSSRRIRECDRRARNDSAFGIA